ncbi:uncharacterized protein LOC113272794 [Papaver somniferum]|uniref:uncharacterized protein LOC113272794 n=1 Tax=Papaver somniferum TaxID=3469 RepID=UPI000E6FF73E|nr:uncharacterized protein LOC113272794 [Papaver somniferum]
MSSKERYLGSPLILGYSKQEAFKNIEENFQKRFTSWSSTSLTQVGRGIMVKHVLNSIPIYQMGTFNLPFVLINKLTTIQRKFFWGYKSNRGFNLIGWNKVCKPKDMGGMAFRDLEMLNLALLIKVAWRLLTEKDSLWTQNMESKYFRDGNILHQKIEAKNYLYTWNGIAKGLIHVQQNYFMEVDNGKKMKIWIDRWIPGLSHPPIPVNELDRFYQEVEERLLPNSNTWNVELINKLFDVDTSSKNTNHLHGYHQGGYHDLDASKR